MRMPVSCWIWIALCLAGCPASQDRGTRGSGEPPAAAGTGAAGTAGTTASAQPDACQEAIAKHPSDLTTLGQLGTCAPTGIPIACRVESPESSCSAAPSADPTALNRCRNANDCAVLAAANLRADTRMGPSVSNIVRGCGLPHLTETDCAAIASSTAACVTTETSAVLAPGLSADCAQCFTQTLLCNLRCLAHCSLDAETPACVACMHVEGCRGLFYQCSGLEPLD